MENEHIYNADSEDERSKRAAQFIESAISDPVIESTIKQAKEYDAWLQFGDISDINKQRFVRYLDEQWSPWLRQEVFVSGKVVQMLAPGIISEPKEVDNLAVISNGFNIHTIRRDGVEYSDNLETHVVYEFFAPVEDFNLNEQRYHPLSARIDDVTIQTDIPSNERALMWLEATSSDFLNEVDRRIQKSSTAEASLLALRGLDIDACVDVRDKLTKNSAELFLDGMIPIDATVPFGVYLDGGSYELQGNARMTLFHQSKAMLGNIKGVTIIEGLSSTGRSNWEIATPFEHHDRDSSTPPVQMIIPVDTFVAIESMRRLFYERFNTGDSLS